MTKILLASTSSTRRRILNKAGIKFIIKKPMIDEEKEKEKLKYLKNPRRKCQEIAKKKSIKTSLKYKNYFVLGVDTCLIYKNEFLSKPRTKEIAKKLLNNLKGKEHKIYSCIFISKNGKKVWKYEDEAKLKIRRLSRDEISNYINKLKLKKIKESGLYQIEEIGVTLFEKIEGSFFTILGLPLIPLLKFLNKKRLLF